MNQVSRIRDYQKMQPIKAPWGKFREWRYMHHDEREALKRLYEAERNDWLQKQEKYCKRFKQLRRAA